MIELYFYFFLFLFFAVSVIGIFSSNLLLNIIFGTIGLIGLTYILYFVGTIEYKTSTEYVTKIISYDFKKYYTYAYFIAFVGTAIRTIYDVKENYL